MVGRRAFRWGHMVSLTCNDCESHGHHLKAGRCGADDVAGELYELGRFRGGGGGVILATEDGGRTWAQQYP